MGLEFTVPKEKQIRVIVDTDAACEADDPFAIAHALLSPKVIVEGITAEHFNEPGSMEKSFDEIETLLNLMDRDVPHFFGQKASIMEDKTISEAAEFIIEQAEKESDYPLFVLCQGAISNVAVAINKCPDIIDKMTVIWIGTHGAGDVKAPFREFNAGNDIEAANYVLQSGVNLWLVPSYIYVTITIGMAEIQRKVAPCGAIGRHLFENMINYNNSEYAFWTQGESWSLGDSPAIALAINPGCGHFEDVKAPFIKEDTSSTVKDDNPIIRVYKDVDQRYILEDFISKLQLEYL